MAARCHAPVTKTSFHGGTRWPSRPAPPESRHETPASRRAVPGPLRPLPNAEPMNTTALPLTTTSSRDVADARNDKLFRWVLTGTALFVLIAPSGTACRSEEHTSEL